MGIVNTSASSNLPAVNLRYSAMLGILYVSSPESEAAIAEVKNAIGDAEWKKGFTGYHGEGASAKAIASLRDKGVTSVKLSGTLTSARTVEREVNGRMAQYLTVGMKDADGRYYLSIDIGQMGAQMLARKLVNAQPGVQTELSLFATYGQRPGATRAYADHVASLKQNGKEVAGISPKDELQPRVQTALKALKDAGVDEKEIVGTKRRKIEHDYHVELMGKVADRFAKFYEDREIPSDDAPPAMEPAAEEKLAA